MKKSEAISMFGNSAELARSVGLTRGRISQWGSELTQKQADLVVGAAVRLGKRTGHKNHKRSKKKTAA